MVPEWSRLSGPMEAISSLEIVSSFQDLSRERTPRLPFARPISVHPLPEIATFAQGAALGIPYATAYRGIFHRGDVRSGETLLVHGASGGVGTAAVQLARGGGHQGIWHGWFSRGSRTRSASLAQTWSSITMTPATARPSSSATQGRGVDCILEMLANVNLGADLAIASSARSRRCCWEPRKRGNQPSRCDDAGRGYSGNDSSPTHHERSCALSTSPWASSSAQAASSQSSEKSCRWPPRLRRTAP